MSQTFLPIAGSPRSSASQSRSQSLEDEPTPEPAGASVSSRGQRQATQSQRLEPEQVRKRRSSAFVCCSSQPKSRSRISPRSKVQPEPELEPELLGAVETSKPERTCVRPAPPGQADRPQHDSASAVRKWLARIKLEAYADAIVEQQGYDALEFLVDLREEDIDELIDDVRMKKGHGERFKSSWQLLVAPAAG